MAEEKDFSWLCYVLATVGVKVSIVETVFLQKDEASLWVYTSKTGKVKKRLLSEQTEKSTASVLEHFTSQHSRSSPDPICTALVKGYRVPIEWAEIDDLASTIAFLGRSTAVQAVFENKSVYVLRVDFNKTGYTSSFTVRKDGLVEDVKSMRLWCKCISLTKVVMKIVEKVRKRPIDSLELELLVSMEGEVYLYGCTRLKLLHTAEAREETDGNGGETNVGRKPTVRDKEKKQKPLRIHTPFLSSTDTKPVIDVPSLSISSPILTPLNETSTVQDVSIVKVTPKGGSVAVGLPRLRRSPTKCADFYNPNFKEMLALMYARGQPEKRNLDLDTLFKDLDSEVLQEDEPKLRLRNSILTVRKAERSETKRKVEIIPRLRMKERKTEALQSQRAEAQVRTRPVHHRSTGSLNSILESISPGAG